MSSLTPARLTTPTTPESLSQMFDSIVIEDESQEHIGETISYISIQSMTEPEIEEAFTKCSLKELQLMILELAQESDFNTNALVNKILIKEIGNRNLSDEELLTSIGCSERVCKYFLNPLTIEETLEELTSELLSIKKSVEQYHNAQPDQIVERSVELILKLISMEDFTEDRANSSYALEETLKALIEINEIEKNQNFPLQYEIIKTSQTLLYKISKSINHTETYKRFECYKNEFYALLEHIQTNKQTFIHKISSSSKLPYILCKAIPSINPSSAAIFFKELFPIITLIDADCSKLKSAALLLLSEFENNIPYDPKVNSFLRFNDVASSRVDHLIFLLKNIESSAPHKLSIVKIAITSLKSVDTVKFITSYCDTPHAITDLLSSSLVGISKEILISLSIEAANKSDSEMNHYARSKLLAISKGTLRLLNSSENIKKTIPLLSDTSRYRLLVSLLPDSLFPTPLNDSVDVQKIAETAIADYHSSVLNTRIQTWEKQLTRIKKEVQDISNALQSEVSIDTARIYKKRIDTLLKSLMNPQSGCLSLLRSIHIANCAILDQKEMASQVNCTLITYLLKSLKKHGEIHSAYTTSKQYQQFCFLKKNQPLLNHINDMIHPVIAQAQEIYGEIVRHTPEAEGLVVKIQRILQTPSEVVDPDDEKIMILDTFIKGLCKKANPYSLTDALLNQHNLSWQKVSDCFMPMSLDVLKKSLETLTNLSEVSLFCSNNIP